MAEEKEVWKNPGRGLVYVQVSELGKVTDRKVPPGGQIVLSYEDRKLNQAQTYFDPSVDVFTNGRLTPVKLIESAEDYTEIASNPNLVTDSDIKEKLTGNANSLKGFLKEVTNEGTLNRFLELADQEEASPAKFRAIKERLAEVKPEVEQESLANDADDEGYTFVDL